jgi:hypothetical protein
MAPRCIFCSLTINTKTTIFDRVHFIEEKQISPCCLIYFYTCRECNLDPRQVPIALVIKPETVLSRSTGEKAHWYIKREFVALAYPIIGGVLQ